MDITRRTVVASALGLAACSRALEQPDEKQSVVYGLLANILAKTGRGPELAQILVRGSHGLTGNLHYLVSFEAGNPDSIWIYEVWVSQQAHEASLQSEQVLAAIRDGRPLIEKFAFREQLSTLLR